MSNAWSVRKHRAPKGALKLEIGEPIKVDSEVVRKHRAPNGALRHSPRADLLAVHAVRKHRAPKGALRYLGYVTVRVNVRFGQKAPSTKRCIKTREGRALHGLSRQVRKHRAPNGALRHDASVVGVNNANASQKAPSAKRCIKTLKTELRAIRLDGKSESSERQTVHLDRPLQPLGHLSGMHIR